MTTTLTPEEFFKRKPPAVDSSIPYLRFATDYGLSYSSVLLASDAIKQEDYAGTIKHIPVEAAPALLTIFNREQMRRRDVVAREKVLKDIKERGHDVL